MALLRSLTAATFSVAAASLFFLLPQAAFAQQTPPPVENPPAPPAVLNAPPAPDQKSQEPRKRLRFGPQIGLYIPTDGRTRSRFGNSWSNIGFGIGNVSNIHQNRRLALDINFISNSNGDSRVFLAPIGLAYSVDLGKARSTTTYAGISANLVIASLRSDIDNLPSRTNAAAGASFFLGNRFGESGFIEARYNAFGKIRTFDLSGVNLRAGYRF